MRRSSTFAPSSVAHRHAGAVRISGERTPPRPPSVRRSRGPKRFLTMRIARRAHDVSLSVTLALDARAKALAAAGRDVINMSVGEPDFPAPAVVQDAACRIIRSGNVRYTA